MNKRLLFGLIFSLFTAQSFAASLYCKVFIASTTTGEVKMLREQTYIYDSDSGYLLKDLGAEFENGDRVRPQVTYFSFPSDTSDVGVDVFTVFSITVIPSNPSPMELKRYTSKRIRAKQRTVPYSSSIKWKGGKAYDRETDAYTANVECSFK